MTDMDKLHDISAQGACCAQAMVYMGLEWTGEHNPLLIKAAGGLCAGMRCGLTCGVLTGAICMLSMFDSSLAYSVMVPEMVEWFQETFGNDSGLNCGSLRGQDKTNYYETCPSILDRTYEKAKEILLENGFMPVSLLDFGLDAGMSGEEKQGLGVDDVLDVFTDISIELGN